MQLCAFFFGQLSAFILVEKIGEAGPVVLSHAEKGFFYTRGFTIYPCRLHPQLLSHSQLLILPVAQATHGEHENLKL